VPFPFVRIEGFLDAPFAAKVAAAFPTFEDALGRTDAKTFPGPVAILNQALASPAFLSGSWLRRGIRHFIDYGH
jgi:hypothetical protein